MLAQKISISLDLGTMKFVEAYLKRHAAKNRSQVVGEAQLETAYSMSAATDKPIAAEFSSTANDGLDHEAW